MPVPRHIARRLALVTPLVLALLAFGCGDDDATSTEATTAPADPADFPAAEGKTLDEIAGEATETDLVAAPTVQVLDPGENRYAFGLFAVTGETVTDAEVALYAARPDGKATGPFPASSTSLVTEPAFASATTTNDPDAATYLYDAEVDLPGEGEWRMLAMVRQDDGTYAYTVMPSAVVGKGTGVPDVGELAPEIHTPTAEDVGGDLSQIDTRQPPDTMHDVDYADVLGKEPIVLSLATPALCTSRVCGPVVDIAEQVKNERPDDAAFIHMEIYTDNDVNKGVNEQVRTFGLPSEPWLFVIDSDGKVSSRLEGAFTKAELDAALDRVS